SRAGRGAARRAHRRPAGDRAAPRRGRPERGRDRRGGRPATRGRPLDAEPGAQQDATSSFHEGRDAMTDDGVPTDEMRWGRPQTDAIDAVLGDCDTGEDLADVAAIVHDLRSTYLPDQPLRRHPALAAF